MIFDINKSSFSAAIKRLQSTFTLQYCLGVVTHRLSRMGNFALMNALNDALGELDDQRGVDRKRASELLSRTLTGESYNVLSSKMKAEAGDSKENADLGTLRARLGELDALMFTIGFEGKSLKEGLIAALYSMVRGNGVDNVGDPLFLTDRKQYMPDGEFFWGSFHALLLEHEVLSVVTNGFDEPVSDHHGLECHKREVEFYLSDGSKISLHYEYKSSEYVDIEEMSCALYINEDDVCEFFDSSETHDDVFVTDRIIEKLSDGIQGAFVYGRNQDLVDVQTDTNQKLLSIALPALCKALN